MTTLSRALDVSPSSSSRKHSGTAEMREGFVERDGLQMYCIPDFDRMPPFLVNVVSDGDVWTYVSSGGALTAGRVEPKRCLFPYVTDDQLHLASEHTGPMTAIRVERDGAEPIVWRPFRERRHSAIERNLYKPVEGTQLIFEERRSDLGLCFCYRWAPTRKFGLVRTAWIEHLDGTDDVQVELVDGLMNLLPAGIDLTTLQRASCLINAYTQAEIDKQTGLLTLCLTSQISDTADPHESLIANTVWSQGLDGPSYGMTRDAWERFLAGEPAVEESVGRNLRPDYWVRASFGLAAGKRRRWDLVADADRTQAEVVALRRRLLEPSGLADAIDAEIESARRGLTAIVAASDGQQCTADQKASAHHFSSVMFNSMRGGTPSTGYACEVSDFLDFVRQRNRVAAERVATVIGGHAAGSIDLHALHALLGANGDADLIRLGLEYVPLWFGRRHGDPSRPWNMFAIHVQRPDGQRILDYQGNWRDIFQNWEALACSFPSLLDGMIAKFVNATTVDGYNPYRVSREGIDWERPDPSDPWANIGYWGDHQIVYLLRLLELWDAHDPGGLSERLDEAVYSYADVPYRLKSHAEVVVDPKHSITFDAELDRDIDRRVERLGTDGRLRMHDGGEGVAHVALCEKLLVPLLSKVCNLVPGGGVWMNTQRPEWNDANNALAGYGLSVVTTCYLRRYVAFLEGLMSGQAGSTVRLRATVADWLSCVADVLNEALPEVQAGDMADDRRRGMIDRLGLAFEAYRKAEEASDHEPLVDVDGTRVMKLLAMTRHHCECTIRQNRRADGLYHSYNLIDFRREGEASVKHLDVMLEGQVAVLSSGMLDAAQSRDVLAAMFESAIYRPEVQSFLLYPKRERPSFLDHNCLEADAVLANPLLAKLLKQDDWSLVERDAEGNHRFNARFSNAADVTGVLELLESRPALRELVKEHGASVVALFDETFDHHAFTGRSGTMYGYEGLGCVYWHMVAKLQVAAQESWIGAIQSGADAALVDELRVLYELVRSGLGFRKDAFAYGAFPSDAYSHTPSNRGAQQPGMTGQVKEEILTRRVELGVLVQAGRLCFDPGLVRPEEFLNEDAAFDWTDVFGRSHSLEVPADAIGFTVCQTAVVLNRSSDAADGPRIEVAFADGDCQMVSGLALDADLSREVFRRTGRVRTLWVRA